MDKKDKDKNNFKGHLNKCFRETGVGLLTKYRTIVTVFPSSLSNEFIDLVYKKYENISDIYDELDINCMIRSKIASFLDYDELFKKISNSIDSPDDDPEGGFVFLGDLPYLLNKSKYKIISDKISDKIIEEIENPAKSYALVQLPQVELSKNIKINSDFSFISDLNDFFYIHNDDKEYFNFPFEKNKTYLLIKHIGRNWRSLETEGQPLFYKTLLHKIKTFFGLSCIMDIFKFSGTFINKSKNKRDIASTVGIFSSLEWAEEARWYKDLIIEEEDLGNPIPEDHPDYNALKEDYSGGDELKKDFFQKRFFIEDEINLPQIYIDLFNSLTITEFATKPSFNLMEGLEIKKPLPQFEKSKNPEQILRRKFEKIRVILNSNDDYAERIKASSLWYFEGYYTENDTFKFIFYTIAVESLLGLEEEEKVKKNIHIPLTERLSNRCGFSMGKSLKEKEKIKNEFTDIYEIRSRIVHRQKTILNKDDNEYLKKLEKITKQLIANTIETYEPENN